MYIGKKFVRNSPVAWELQNLHEEDYDACKKRLAITDEVPAVLSKWHPGTNGQFYTVLHEKRETYVLLDEDV